MHCHFHNPVSIHSGPGMRRQIGALAAKYGKKALIVTTGSAHSRALAEEAGASLEAAGLGWAHYNGIRPNPLGSMAAEGAQAARDNGCDMVIGIGGGSVMDTSKIISVMMTNPGYYDDLTDQSKIVNRGAPLLVAPTSAGTGSEATPNAIVLIPEKKLKVGVVHPYFLPCRVLLDPELTKSLPKSVTASTGVDAFCHCIETYISRKTNPFARVFGLKGIELISKYLRRAYEDGSDMEARENMLLAAFYGGVAITASSTVAVHALSYPLGGTYRIPHGVSNAILLPFVMRYNMDAIQEDLPTLAAAMGLDTTGTAKELEDRMVEALFTLCRDLNIPDNLQPFGVKPEDLEFLTVSASEVHRLLDQNPKTMSLDDIRNIYTQLL